MTISREAVVNNKGVPV
jgi:hypothetical protein